MNKKQIEFRDPVVERVVDKFVSRSDVGFAKYGVTLNDDKSNLFAWINHLQEELMDAVLYMQKLKESTTEEMQEALLKNIEVQNNKLLLGSAVTIENFLVTIKDRIPELIELLQRFGSPQIRNQGTIGGNLCTSSPIGDIAPIFLALNAKLNIFGSNGRKKVNLNEFYTGYRKNILNMIRYECLI